MLTHTRKKQMYLGGHIFGPMSMRARQSMHTWTRIVMGTILVVSICAVQSHSAEITHKPTITHNTSHEPDNTPATLEIFLHTWNEAHMLPYTVRFYRTRFPTPGSLRITVYDGNSTDGTLELAQRLGCEVHTRKANRTNTLDVAWGTAWRNSVWKTSTADWVLIVDTDEWVDVWPEALAAYKVVRVTAVVAVGVHLVWPHDTLDLSRTPLGVWGSQELNQSYGVQPPQYYDKPALFYRRAMKQTRISDGGHTASPIGRGKWLHQTPFPPPPLFHARYFDVATLTARYEQYRARMSAEHKKKGWGVQYMKRPEDIAAEVAYVRRLARPLPWRVF